MSAPRTLRVDVVSDVVCPWCFVGKRRLEAAARFLNEATLDVHWRPFQLDGTIPPGGIPRRDYLTRKFGSVERYREMSRRLEAIGEAEGIAFAFERIEISPNTFDAHRLLLWAEPRGRQGALKQRLFELYFVEGANLADAGTLAGAAESVGLDREEASALLASDALAGDVRHEIEAAHRLAVSGVPFFIFGGRVALSGAHEPQTLADAARQALARGPGGQS
jgi:predicted DsbA family dithiol-disulfide isomerase